MRAVKVNTLTQEITSIENITENNCIASASEFIWLDITTTHKDSEKALLQNILNIPELAINDAQSNRHPPKFEQLDKYIFTLIKAFDANQESVNFSIVHTSFFVSDNFLITVHQAESSSVNLIWNTIEDNDTELSPFTIMFLVLRKIVDEYTQTVLQFEKRLEEIEEEMLKNPNDALLNELIRYSSKSQYLMRIFNNQTIVLDELHSLLTSTLDNPSNKAKTLSSSNKNRILFTPKPVSFTTLNQLKDVQEHMTRMSGLVRLFSEIIQGLINGYISVTGHRLNSVMKILTIVSIMFLPITFIAGIYGMNFEYIPELSFKYGYFMAIGLMLAIVTGLILLFKKFKWI